MQSVPKSLRLQIGLFGRRNVGKSSLLNAIARQQVSIVSEQAGTTTDPIEKPMELLPLGPVLLIDTAGIDDEGTLGSLRKQRSESVLDRADLGVLVTEADSWGLFEDSLLEELKKRKVPVLVVINKSDLQMPSKQNLFSIEFKGCAAVTCSANTGDGIADVIEAMLRLAPSDHFECRHLISDLVQPGDTALLVTPIDKQAPKGRLILPQVMTIRDLLDGGSIPMVCQQDGIPSALENLRNPPAIVITDSQAFDLVSEKVPESVPMTSFSILMARFQGDLTEMVRSAKAISNLKEGDRVLILETCSHHPTGDDIGRVKIPNWLRKFVGAQLKFEHAHGRDFPENLSPYKLVIHCGNCMGNRREMLNRIHRCRSVGVPITNYGLTIAYSLGILERALKPFPNVLDNVFV
ncbi:MAG: [FeFe] hydrogenase H-cluster maturation GTPase HydF [Holophagales bacterium]|jgi:[FeFe] hydrogenase H-cluster maturation GTPase HydF|nr:[FeFe] hydrogenase H-cluster maturation GTPase HydF [Holophagales bacterium]